MDKRYKALGLFGCVVFGLVLGGLAKAHQPRIVEDSEVIEIENPEVSQAFYGVLEGEPDFYQIRAEKPFRLYIGVLVPDIQGIDKDVSVKVSLEEKVLFLLDGLEHEWTYYYEEYAGDSYYKGPEKRAEVERGVYNIEVSSPDNQGKYVLVVGEKEEFPLGEAIKTLVSLPKLKKQFFERSVFAVFSGKIGRGLLFALIGVVIVIGCCALFLIVWLARRRIKQKPRN